MKFPTGGKVREPLGRTGVIPVPTVKSGWKKCYFYILELDDSVYCKNALEIIIPGFLIKGGEKNRR